MPREKDPFRRYVTFLNENNSKWRCNFCGQENGGGAQRIKAHLAGIGGFGIKGCERVDVNVRADAKVVLMAKRVMDSSDRGVYEERIQGNVGAAPTSTSNPPNVEGGTNLQFPQGVPPLTPQTRGWMEQIVQEDRAVDIANLPIDGATSYSSASPPPNSFFPDSPNALLPILSESLTLNAQHNPSAPLPSQNRQLLGNPSQNESRGSILPSLIASDAQLTDVATTDTPQHFNQPDQTFHRQCGHCTGLSPPRVSMDIEPPILSQSFNGPPIIEPFNSPPQIPEDIINTTYPSTSEGNSNLDCNQPRISSVTSVTNTVPLSNQPLPSCNEEFGTETSSFPLRDSRGICPVTALRHTRCPHIEATLVTLQVLENGANTAGLSPSQVQPALVPPPHQSVPHQYISPQTRNAQQNPTGLSLSQKNYIVPCHPQAPMNMDPCILSSSQAPNNAPPPPQIPRCVTGLTGPSSLSELDKNKGAPLMSHTNTDNNFDKSGALKRKIKRLYSREADIRDELEFATSLSLKKQRMEVKNWLADVEKLRNDFHSIEATSEDCLPPHQQVDILMQEAKDLMEQGKFQKGLFVARETKVNKMLERKLVGEASQINTTKILEYLVGNQISRLGIYGMGGVGKTTLMVHIHNRLLEKANYDNVLWITVSQDFNTQKLQDDIWEALSLGILREKDVRKRATMLSDDLTKREKVIIILDDVWECFDLEEVGIPIRADGLKLVLTTRSFRVCCQMRCQKKIKIEPLSQKEAQSLFLEELGSEVALSLETEAVVQSIVKECAGLPLGVITMAASMRGVMDVFEWKDCLVKLKESDMEKKVLMNLKFSYDRLGNPNVQQCFLSCALYPEDKLIHNFKLIEFFIDQGLIGGLSTRKKQYDRALTILNKLGDVCLLEDHGDKMKMHDLLRDMALHIMSVTSIVKTGNGLTRIPPKECWTNDLEKVSLMENEIDEFSLNMSPNCPKLSTLLLNNSLSYDVVIPNSFFKHLRELKVLDLSGCELGELPKSISYLVKLRALLLSNCVKLCHIPSLGKLKSLRKLDICGCVNLEALEGLEMLVNLRYLDLTETRIGRLPKGTLGGLLNLQVLMVEAELDLDDVTELWPLEVLVCNFEHVDDFNKCMRVIKQINPDCYTLVVDQEKSKCALEVYHDSRFGNWRSVEICGWNPAIRSMRGESTNICLLIPEDVKKLTCRKWVGTTNLFDIRPLENLEKLKIEEWKNLWMLCGRQDEEIIDIHDSPAPTPTPTPFLLPSLRVLKISGCPKLKYLFGHGSKFYLPHLLKIAINDCEEMVMITAAITSPPPHTLPAFPRLEEIIIVGCDKMKRVLESEWLPHFPNLTRVTVINCGSMEEIIRGPPPNMPIEEISLKSLVVDGCDNMINLFPYEWLVNLRNLQDIEVDCCKGMVEMISGVGQGQGSIMTPINNTLASFQSSISLPKLKLLRLCDLPQLKSVCEVPITCDSMKFMKVSKCSKLKGIPLQLRLRDIEDLPYIYMEDEEKWKTLMWDHPNAQAILQPYLRKGETLSNFWESTDSPNAIELSAKGKDLLQLCS